MQKYEKPVMEVLEIEGEMTTFGLPGVPCSPDCIGQITGDVPASPTNP